MIVLLYGSLSLVIFVSGISGFGDFASFQSVPVSQPPPAQPQQQSFADFGAFQGTSSSAMSQVCGLAFC